MKLEGGHPHLPRSLEQFADKMIFLAGGPRPGEISYWKHTAVPTGGQGGFTACQP